MRHPAQIPPYPWPWAFGMYMTLRVGCGAWHEIQALRHERQREAFRAWDHERRLSDRFRRRILYGTSSRVPTSRRIVDLIPLAYLRYKLALTRAIRERMLHMITLADPLPIHPPPSLQGRFSLD